MDKLWLLRFYDIEVVHLLASVGVFFGGCHSQQIVSSHLATFSNYFFFTANLLHVLIHYLFFALLPGPCLHDNSHLISFYACIHYHFSVQSQPSESGHTPIYKISVSCSIYLFIACNTYVTSSCVIIF